VGGFSLFALTVDYIKPEDRNANPLEVMYNVIDENTINVFHAMKCRKSYLRLIKTRGENDG
jgi:hypothetical protein